jgi:hypothetical protein
MEECPVFDMAAEDADDQEVAAEVCDSSVTSFRNNALRSFIQGLARLARLLCGAGIAFLVCLMCLHTTGLGPKNLRQGGAAGVVFSHARILTTALQANANLENIMLSSSWYTTKALHVLQSTATDTIPNAARRAGLQVQPLLAAVGADAYTPECANLQNVLALLKPMATVVVNVALEVYADHSDEIAAVFVAIVIALGFWFVKTGRCCRSRFRRDVDASGVTAPMKAELSRNCAPANNVQQDFADMVGKSPVGAAVVMGLSVSQRMISAATKQDETGVLDFASQSYLI